MEDYMKNVVIKDNIKNIKLDIGLSYNAPMSQIWLNKEPNVFVFGFEPNIESVSNISSNYDYDKERFLILPFALQNVNEPCKMSYYKTKIDPGTSSLFKPTDPRLGDYTVEQNISVYSLKHFFDLFPWDRFEYIDYIKIDAQGSDFDIIKSAGNYLTEKVVYITAEPEFNQYEDIAHNNEKNMEDYLISQNFTRIYHENTQDPTFLNKKFQHLSDKIFIYQKG